MKSKFIFGFFVLAFIAVFVMGISVLLWFGETADLNDPVMKCVSGTVLQADGSCTPQE